MTKITRNKSKVIRDNELRKQFNIHIIVTPQDINDLKREIKKQYKQLKTEIKHPKKRLKKTV